MAFLVWREIESDATSNDRVVQTCDYLVSRKYIYFQVNNMIARLAEFLLICYVLRVLEKTRNITLSYFSVPFPVALFHAANFHFCNNN